MPTEEAIATLRPWAAGERETFFDAIARHRRAAWRVTAASAVADAVVAVVVALLMAPVFYAALVIACDLANLVRPAPNLAAIVFARLDPLVEQPSAVPFGDWLTIGALAAAPGLVWMVSVLIVMHRAVRTSSVFSGDIPARAPDPRTLQELRFAHVVEEMAIAAHLPEPRVLIVDSKAANAAVFGPDERRATIVATSALLQSLDRDELQGVAADLVSAIANGDMTIGLRVAATLGLFGFIGCMAGSFTDRRAMRRLLGRTIKAALWPTSASARAVLDIVADPFAPADASDDTPSAQPRPSGAAHDGRDAEGWRALVWMPLAGPVAMAGFFAGIINLFVLQPLVSFAWRQRKYMADATAVRLTRDPDTLAGALQTMSRARGGGVGAWTSHLCVIQPGASGGGLFGASFVPSYPSIERRLRALAKMGAHVVSSRAHVSVLLVLGAIPIVAILVVLIGLVLYLMAFLSIALSMLFLGLPLGVLHVALRALAGALGP